MGFYAPAQIVRDLREHGVEVRPIDINHSDWDAVLEPGPPPAPRVHALHREMAHDMYSTHAVRLGLRQIKGLPEQDGRRIVAARRTPYRSIRDLWLRSGLSPRRIERLADADAFGSLGLTRRQALWAAKALGRVGEREDDLPLFRQNPDAIREGDQSSYAPEYAPEPKIALPPMSQGEEVVHDYRSVQLSLREHPASFLRPDLIRRGIICNADLRSRASGERITISGLVTIRQRPGTASGVIFMTIEDETAIANIIVWPKTFERFRSIILGARYISVTGELQQEAGVIHVVASRLDDLTPLLARLTENAPPPETLARADAVKRPYDENIDSRARGRRNPPRLAAPAELPDFCPGDLDVPARGSAHAPARRAPFKM
jgi:error-prone DNA polymerase